MNQYHSRLGHDWQELFFNDFIIFSMTIDLVLLSLSILFLHCCESSCFEISHACIVFIIEIRITVFKIFLFGFLLNLLTTLSFFLHLFLNLNGLVLHGFFHDHLVEDASLHLHTCTSYFASVVLHLILFNFL